MQKFKKFLMALLFPPAVLVALLVPVSIVLLVYSFVFENANFVLVYVSYGLSAYALTVLCVRIPNIIKWVKDIRDNNKYVNIYRSDASLRVTLSLYGSLLVNTAYSVFQLGLGIYNGSFWYYSLAGYYISLVIMRFFVLRDIKSNKAEVNMASALKRYRFCGVILLLMNISLMFIVFFMVYFGRGSVHHEIITITIAAYTFFSLTTAIVNVVKYSKYKNPLLSASKAISLAAASVSMLTLTTTMLTVYGTESDMAYKNIMILLVGIAVCLFIMVMAICMIVRSTKQLNKIKRNA